MTQRQVEYAQRYGASAEDIQAILDRMPPSDQGYFLHYHASGFSRPLLPVITNEEPGIIQFYRWGLIPSWVKDSKSAGQIAIKTLNARSETIFEKPSFRSAAKKKRCIVVVDGFFEHHHQGSRTYPFYIGLKSSRIISLAGLWEEWLDKETGELVHTVSIVTTGGNNLLARIHNNPKLSGPRMPMILQADVEREWLMEVADDKELEHLKKLMKPYDEADMFAYPVRRLRGKNAVGDRAEAIEAFHYDDLQLDLS